jgi:hypothetical protein
VTSCANPLCSPTTGSPRNLRWLRTHTNSVGHALDCKTGGLIIQRHNEIANKLADLCGKALTPSAVHDKPSIYYPDSRISPTDSRQSTLSNQPVLKCKSKSNDEDRGNLLVRGLWQCGTHCVIDVRVTNINGKSQQHIAPAKVLAKHEREKKAKYLEACLDQRMHFSPFVVSTDEAIGQEAKTLLKRLSALLDNK